MTSPLIDLRKLLGQLAVHSVNVALWLLIVYGLPLAFVAGLSWILGVSLK